jgi:7-cyano-7-deazaguanine reductase
LSEITEASDLESLTILGNDAKPSKNLEIFPNRHPDRDYKVTLLTEEFTCLCPLTAQPDFAKITIQYTPDKSIVESKSLKLYLASFRNEGAFHEHVTNTILDDLVKATAPRWCKVTANFALRGGIAITVEAEYKKAPPILAPPVSAEDPEKSKRVFTKERPTAGRRYDKSPPTRADGRWDRSRQGRDTQRPAQEKQRPEEGEKNKSEAEPRRFEKRITKPLGETRVWRKKM